MLGPGEPESSFSCPWTEGKIRGERYFALKY